MYTEKHTDKKIKNPKKHQLSNSRALSTRFVQNEEADRSYFITSTVQGVGNFLYSRVTELYNSLTMTFSLDTLDFNDFKKYIWPVVSSGAALLIGEYVTQGISQYQTGSTDY